MRAMAIYSPVFSPKVILLSVLLLVSYIGYVMYQAWYGALARLPGPRLAKYTSFWRMRTAASKCAPQAFRKVHADYGTVVRIGPHHVSVSDPTQIPVIYGISSKFPKSDFYKCFVPTVEGQSYASMFSEQNQKVHRELVRGIAHKYSLSSLLGLEPLVDGVTRDFISTLKEEAEQSGIEYTKLDLGKWVQFYAFDVIGAITFSRTFGFIEAGKDDRKVIDNLEVGLTYGGVIGQLPQLHPWLMANPVLQNTILKIPSIARGDPVPIVFQMIKDELAREEEDGQGSVHEDFLTYMKKQAEKDPERMSQWTQHNHLFVNLLAGSDTTAISLRTIFYYLMKNPRVYQKLQGQIDAADKAGKFSSILTYTEAQEHVPYLALVVKEALRIHPAVALPLERLVPAGGVTMNRVHIPEGTNIGVSAWVVHYDKNVFGEDVDTFRPDRWENDGSEECRQNLMKMERSFFAFGHGARSCIGKNISLMEMGKFVPQFLREFEIEWDGAAEWKVESNWFAKQTEIYVRYKPRQEHSTAI